MGSKKQGEGWALAKDKSRRELAFDACADLEAENWAGAEAESGELFSPRLVCGSLFYKGKLQTWWCDEAGFLDALLAVEGVCWWHYGRRFDLLWMIDGVMERGLEPELRTNGKGVVNYLRVGDSIHRDSSSLWGVPLSQFAAGTEYPKVDLGLRCICGKHCGGYCSIKADCSPGQRRKIIKRNVGDVLSLWAGLERLAKLQESIDIDGRNSVGSSAWATVKRRYRLPDADQSWSRHQYNRGAYIAGRVEVIRPASARAYEYDLTMAYPSFMRTMMLPMGEATRVFGRAASEALARRQPGVYCATVRSPEAYLPILPYKTRRNRVGYPTGDLQGTWTLPELSYALANGYQLLTLHSAQVYDRQRVILRDWVDELWQHRQALAAAGDEGHRYVKAAAVALVGVFGLSPYTEDVIFDPPASEIRVCPCMDLGHSDCPCGGVCCGERCQGECGAMSNLNAYHSIWTRPRRQLLGRSHVIWSSYINGGARVELHRTAVMRNGGADVVHFGTDSILCSEPRPEGHGPGKWVKKHTLLKVRFHHANVFEGIDEQTGEVLVRTAGHERNLSHNLLRDGEIQTWRPVSLREGLAGGKLFTGRVSTRHLQVAHDRAGRRWYGARIEDGDRTRAPTVEELNAL